MGKLIYFLGTKKFFHFPISILGLSSILVFVFSNGNSEYLAQPNRCFTENYDTIANVLVKEKEPKEYIFITEKMPRFPGCEAEEGDPKTCADLKMLKFLYSNFKYPSVVRESSIVGTIFVQFAVEKDGSIVDVNVVRGLEKHMDAEAVRVVEMMPKWIPGEQMGKPVRVQFTLPIRIKLSE